MPFKSTDTATQYQTELLEFSMLQWIHSNEDHLHQDRLKNGYMLQLNVVY